MENPVFAKAHLTINLKDGQNDLDESRRDIINRMMFGIYMLPLPVRKYPTLDEIVKS